MKIKSPLRLKLVTASTLKNLEAAVNVALGEGAELHGGIVRDGPKGDYIQAVKFGGLEAKLGEVETLFEKLRVMLPGIFPQRGAPIPPPGDYHN